MAEEIEKRLRKDLLRAGDFSRVHTLPHGGQDVPDDRDSRLVVLGPGHPYSKDQGSAALTAAKAILQSRGNVPRLYQNTLVFLAPDKIRLQDLDEAVRQCLAWESIVGEQETLDLSPHQMKQAESRLAAADATVTARLPETYQWLLLPAQSTPQSPLEWQAVRLSGADALAVRASKKLRNDELLLTAFAGTRLRMELDRVLWRGTAGAVGAGFATGTGSGGGVGVAPAEPPVEPGPAQPRRFHGSVTLSTERVGLDAGRIAEEVIAHLAGLMGANVKVTLEVEAEVPDGVPEHVVRVVTENSRTLKFTSQGFERE